MLLTAGVRVLSAARAELRIGIATARSESHSSLIAFAAFACSLATVSSAFTVYNSHRDSIRHGGRITIGKVIATVSGREVTPQPAHSHRHSVSEGGYITDKRLLKSHYFGQNAIQL